MDKKKNSSVQPENHILDHTPSKIKKARLFTSIFLLRRLILVTMIVMLESLFESIFRVISHG